MATVDSGSFVGTPARTGQTQSNRRAIEEQNGQADAYGATTDEMRKAQTGVDPGAAGYSSGQVAPASTAGAVPTGIPRGTPLPTPAPAPGPTAPVATTVGSNGGQQQIGGYSGGGAPPPGTPTGGVQAGGSGVTTRTGAITSGSPQVSPGFGAGAVTSPIASNTSGTTQGESPIPTGGDISPTVNVLNRVSPGLGDKYDVGSNFLRPTQADLSPTQDANAKAFGISDNLDTERYNYRPGQAPAQTRVELDTTNPDQIRERQLAALGGLNDAANGRVPSAAEIQMRREAARNSAATLGAARALGGRSAGGAARAGTLASADILSQNNVAGAQLRASEQERARAAEIAALGGVRGQDTDISQANANLNQAANANNLTAQTQANQLAEQHRQALLDAQLKALGIGTTAAGDTVSASKANADADNKLKGGILDMGSKALAFL